MNDKIISVKGLSVFYDDKPILENINFTLEKGRSLVVIGPNGSGKTTLLKAILDIVPYQGEIEVKKGVRIGYVPQKMDIDRDLPITVKEFLELRVDKKKKRTFLFKEALSFVKLKPKILSSKLSTLSSGEIQRVFIVWAIIERPDLLLFDEPTASVDIAGQEVIYDFLGDLQRQYSTSLILISHDLNVVYSHADEVLCLNHNQVCYGPPSEALTPEVFTKLYGHHRFYHHNHRSHHE